MTWSCVDDSVDDCVDDCVCRITISRKGEGSERYKGFARGPTTQRNSENPYPSKLQGKPLPAFTAFASWLVSGRFSERPPKVNHGPV